MSSCCSFPSQNDQTEMTISGVKVSFPGKPYPSQLAMMGKILIGLKTRQSCLLESPTGSGKTLALLCASLAWQKAELEAFASACPLVATEVPNEPAEEEEEEEEEVELKEEEEDDDEKVGDHVRIHARIKRTSSNRKDIKEAALLNTNNNVNRDDYDSGDDFQVPKPKNATAANPTMESPNPAFRCQRSLDQKKSENLTDVSSPCISPLSSHEDRTAVPNCNPVPERPKVPKIFFGTRTHKQIAQVIRELRKTVYSDIRMTVLASREHTCIHPTISKHDNKNENCADLIKGRNGSHCNFYLKYSKLSKKQPQVPSVLAWDIEDMVAYGKNIESCPYFMTRDLLDEAQIVFCPYNYLTEPAIRRSMQINLANQIVIFDEAHNIEDTARDAASFSLTALDLLVTIKDLQEFIDYGGPYRETGILKDALGRLSCWISKESATIKSKQGYSELSQIWRGVDMVAALSTMQLGPDRYKDLISCMKSLNEFAEQAEKHNEIRLSAFASKLIEGLLIVLDFLYRGELANMDDYRVALVVTRSFKQNFLGRKLNAVLKESGYDRAWTCTLNFWCLNPAVSFSDISQSVRCIVLTSGTLSPMKSFQSELGVNFPIKLEANHVIDPSQVWIGQISQGPMNNHLNGSYKYSETFVFQDEIGEIVHRVCSEVPYGVLCFFPSYSLLNKVTERWQTTGLYKRLEGLKVVLSEPRGSQKVEFTDVLSRFYDAVEQPYESDNEDNFSAVNGALLFAVCRGKVSEGLDFSDNNARAVITVGIPFPNYKDLQVSLKKAYNNENCKKRDLLNGNEWYEIQAFRALNQALGRCIRHRKDWGVLYLVDSRIASSESYKNSLSRWVRNKLKLYHSFSAAQKSLHDFIGGRKALEKCQSDSFCATKILSPMSCSQTQLSQDASPMKSSSLSHCEESPSYAGHSSLTMSPDIMARSPRYRNTTSTSKDTMTARKLLSPDDNSPRIQEEYQETTEDSVWLSKTPVPIDMDTNNESMSKPRSNVVVKPSLRSKRDQLKLDKNVNTGTKKKWNAKRAIHDATKPKKPFVWYDPPVCRPGMWCANCGQQLISTLEDVQASSKNLIIIDTADHHKIGERKHFCECIQDNSCIIHNIFVKNRDALRATCDNVVCTQGCNQNAIWSEEDKMCFREVQCKSCKISIGFQVLAAQRGNAQCDQVWLVPCNTAFCVNEKPICYE